MSEIRILSRNAIRKNMAQYVTFGLVVILASLMFHIGAVIERNFTKSFEDKWEKYNCSDAFVIMMKSDYKEEYLNDIASMDGVEKAEKRECIYLNGSFYYNNDDFSMANVFFNMEDGSTLSNVGIVEERKELTENSAYLSYYLKFSGYDIGDEYVYKANGVEYRFTIAGFVEDMLYGTQSIGMIGVYLPQKSYDALAEKVGDGNKAIHIGTVLDHRSSGKAVSTKISDLLSLEAQNSYATNYYEYCKQVRTMSASMGGMIFTAFAIIILIVSMLVSNFRINNDIEEEMQSMGALKALGYTGKQIILSTVVPYVLIAEIASFIGIGVSYSLLPILSQAFNAQTGFKWMQGFDGVALCITVVVIVIFVYLAAYITASKIKKVSPINALKGGVSTHNFRKNHFPIATTIGNANVILAMKTLVGNGKKNILLFLVIFATTFTAIFTGTMYYNVNIDATAFINALVEVNPSVYLITDINSSEQILKELQTEDNVNKALFYDEVDTFVDEENVKAFVTEDFSKLDNVICYEGRSPIHENEIAIGNELAASRGVSVGDKIAVSSGTEQKEFLITGLVQSINQQGNCIQLTAEAYTSIKNGYIPSQIIVYLNDETKSESFINAVTNQYGDAILGTQDGVKSVKSAMKTFENMTGILCIIILIIAVIVIALILYMIIKTLIYREKIELGISKALGYTTTQLRFQVSISFLPVVLLGVLAGGITGKLFMNQAVTVLFHILGVMKLEFSIPMTMIIGACIGIGVLGFVIAMMISGRIKRISAYSLIQE